MRILNHKAGKTSTATVVVILAAIIVVAFFLGIISFSAPGVPSIPTVPTQPTTPTTPTTPTGAYSGILYLEVVDSVLGTGVTTSTTTVDVVAAANGQFDFVSGSKDTKTQAANPQAMNSIWAEGTELIIMADCDGNPTSGLDYYPAMYYVKLADGASIYELTSLNCFQQVGSSPYKYSINPSAGKALSNRVSKYESSNVYYWNLGKLAIYPRQQANSFDQYLMYSGTNLASVTDAATWIDTSAEITANATLASTNEKITFEMVGALASVGWGKNFFVVTQQGKIQEYGSVIAITTAMTGLSNSKLMDDGWEAMTANTLYAEKGFYKVLTMDATMMPAKGSKPHWTVDIPIDSSAATASTAYLFRVWVNDCQNLANLQTVGLSNSTITAYGFVTSYGVGASVANTGMTFASGCGDAEQLQVYLTTPA